MRVLIADDQPGVGNTVALLVNAAKHHVVKVVTSGAQAIRAYHIYRPDVVLMDYSMNRLNGATACRYILTEDPGARIVFVSSRPASALAESEPLPFCRSRWTSRNSKNCSMTWTRNCSSITRDTGKRRNVVGSQSSNAMEICVLQLRRFP